MEVEDNIFKDLDQTELFEIAYNHCSLTYNKKNIYFKEFLSEFIIAKEKLKLALGWACLSLLTQNKIGLEEEITNKMKKQILIDIGNNNSITNIPQ